MVYINKVSHSKHDCYKQCPWKYWLRYHERIRSEKSDISPLQFGSYIHRIFELGFEAKTFQDLRDIGEEIRGEYEFEGPRYSNEIIEQCIRNFLRFNATLEKTIGVEIEYSITDEANDYSNTGVIDRVIEGKDGSLLVIDYKTGKYEKTKKELLLDPQMKGYAVACSNLYNVPLGKITAAHFYPVTGNFVSVKYMPWSQAQYLKEKTNFIWKVRKAKKGQFPARKNKFCNWCEYKEDYCPLFSLPSLVQKRIDEAKA